MWLSCPRTPVPPDFPPHFREVAANPAAGKGAAPLMPNTPDPAAAPTKALWPPVAVPGQPDPDRTAPEDAVAEPKTTPSQRRSAPIGPLTQGDQALVDLAAQIERYVVLPSPEALTAVTLWVAATHLQRVWQHAPRLAVVGPAKRCGKSRLLDVITETVHDPLITVNASAAAIFRSIGESDPPTLLVDEVDTIFGSAKVAECAPGPDMAPLPRPNRSPLQRWLSHNPSKWLSL